jgi:translation elongation factor EF-Tu-like GTPase
MSAHFLLSDCFALPGRPTVMAGQVERGTICPGLRLDLPAGHGLPHEYLTVTAVEIWRLSAADPETTGLVLGEEVAPAALAAIFPPGSRLRFR